jgi:hypothetical protein
VVLKLLAVDLVGGVEGFGDVVLEVSSKRAFISSKLRSISSNRWSIWLKR